MAEMLSKTVEEAGVPAVPVVGLPGGETQGTAAPPPAPVLPYAGPNTSPPVSDWSPLKNPIFRSMWLASAVSYTGYEIRNYAAPLLMVDFRKVFGVSEGMAAYTFTASTLPIPLLVLLAGALADVLDRRKLLIVTHLAMMVVAGLLGILTIAHLMTPWLMLSFLFVIGIGYAMMNPTLLAVIPELVQPAELRSALALNGLNMNIARVLGPFIGGLIVLVCGSSHFYAGKGIAFLATAASLAGVIWVVMRWNPPARKVVAHPENVWGAIRTGFRYTWFSPALLAILARVFIFIFCAGILQTFAGMICKNPANIAKLHGDTGAMVWMICFGLGAVVGVYQMQKLQRRFGIEEVVTVCTITFGLATLGVAHTPNLWLGCLAMAAAGFSWVIVPTNFNIATQLAVPAWIKGRAMGMYVLVLWGSMSAGSAVFGRLATAYGSRAALGWAGIGVLLGAIPILWLRLVSRSSTDFAPAKRDFATTPPSEDGPVRVSVEYHVDDQRRAAFEGLMLQLRGNRLRNGASDWQLAEAAPGRFTESFAFFSWRDRVRHHDRTTKADLEMEEQAAAMHTGAEPPAVRYSSWTPPPGPLSRENLGRGLDHSLDRFASELDRMFERLSAARARDLLHRRRGPDETTEEAIMLIELPVIRERR